MNLQPKYDAVVNFSQVECKILLYLRGAIEPPLFKELKSLESNDGVAFVKEDCNLQVPYNPWKIEYSAIYDRWEILTVLITILRRHGFACLESWSDLPGRRERHPVRNFYNFYFKKQ